MSFSNPPKFFKTIQNHELQNGELRVPKKFVQTFWKGITNPIVLRLPNSVQQEVFWIKRDGDIWLQKNWEKLAKFLKYGYVLVFKYIGGACFKVEIFGLNTLEINYDSIKFLDEVVSDDEKGSEARKEDFEVSDDGKRNVDMDFDATSQNISSRSSRRDINKRAKTNVASTSETRESDTNNDPSFDLTLTSTYARGYYFRIPIIFSRKYMKGYEGDAMLKVGDGEDKTWKVAVRYDFKRKNSIMNSGWKTFCTDNNLQIDDICKFLMIRSEPLSFTIIIIRAQDKPSDSKGSIVMEQKKFQIVVNSCYPYVPSNVFCSHGDCHEKSAELKVDEKSWFVKLYTQKSGNRFYEGWRKFKKDCQLKNGDTCFLELIDEIKLVFKVSFKRKNQ